MYNSIGLSDYNGMGLQGFGYGSMEQVNDLNKALTTGYAASPDLQTGGAALRVESLEESMKVLTYTDRHIVFWRDIPKSPAMSTVEEYTLQDSYGNDYYQPFLAEGQLGIENDSVYRRSTALVKYLGTTRSVTHQASLVQAAHGDLIAKENEAGILWLLRQLEKFLYNGDSTLAPPGQEGKQFDGLTNLIHPESFIDLEGAPLQEADFDDASNLIALNYGYPSDIYCGYTAHNDLKKTTYARHRQMLPAGSDGRLGQPVNSIVTQGGELKFNLARFIERPATAPTAARGPANLTPDAIASFTATPAAGSALGEFDKSQGSLNAKYGYIVTAGNQYGESAPSTAVLATMTAANAVAGYEIQLSITNAVSLTRPPEYFNIYRTLALDSATATAPTDKAAYSLVQQVPAQSQASSGVTPIVAGAVADQNFTMPFTEECYVGQLSPEVITFRQLAPLMKMDLAQLGPAYRWMIMLYGVPLLFARRKWAKIKNIGRLGA